MLRTILSAAACAALGFNLAACGNDPAGSAASGPTPQATTNSPAPASSSPAPARTTAAPAPKTAGQVAAAIKPKIRQVSRVVVWTEETDANNLLGRPGGYTSAATLVDRRAECTDPQPGVDCGAKLEVFRTAEEAQARADYIARILKAAPLLGTEYHYLGGPTLLRVTGELTPTQAKAYEAAMRALTG